MKYFISLINHRKKELKIALIAIIFIIISFSGNLLYAFLGILFLTFIFFRIDFKYVAQASIICILCLPPLIFLGKEVVAQEISELAFFLIIFTVIIRIVQYVNIIETTRLDFIDKPAYQVSKATKRMSHTLDLRVRRAVLDLRHIK